MKVLVIIRSSPVQRYVARLLSDELIREVKDLISSKKHSKAISAVLARGSIEKNVSRHELHDIKADLVLSETSARWDLTK